jgi:hypothetical protein
VPWATTSPPASPPSGPEVNQPVAGADHVQVVLDHDQGVPDIEQSAQCAHQLGDVVKMQAGGGLVKHEERAAFSGPAPGRWRFGLLAASARKARQLQALGLAAGQCGHRLAQLHVFQAHIHNRLQGANHLTVIGKQSQAAARRDGQIQHIGHIAVSWCATPLHQHFQISRGDSAFRRSPDSAGTRRSGIAFQRVRKPEPPQVGQRPSPLLKLNLVAV